MWTLTAWTRTTAPGRRSEPWVSSGARGPATRSTTPADDVAEPGAADLDDTDDESAVRWERPPPRYRPGRGGFDPEEDAEKARARYAVPPAHRAHPAGVRAAHRRRRGRRVPRGVVGARRDRPRAGGVPDLPAPPGPHGGRSAPAAPPGWPAPGGRWRPTTASSTSGPAAAGRSPVVPPRPRRDEPEDPIPTRSTRPSEDDVEEVDGWADEDDDATRVRGVGEPVGCHPPGAAASTTTRRSPRAPAPAATRPAAPIPPGTSLVVVDDDDLDLHDLGTWPAPPARGGGVRG